jgi:hypothetical protein
MDALALVAVVLVFLCCLGLHFATARPVVAPPPIPPAPKPVYTRPCPAVLRQNVAVARLMRM